MIKLLKISYGCAQRLRFEAPPVENSLPTAQHARPNVIGQILPLRAQPTRSSTLEITNSAVEGFARAAAALVAIFLLFPSVPTAY